jgi:hypothetical protein
MHVVKPTFRIGNESCKLLMPTCRSIDLGRELWALTSAIGHRWVRARHRSSPAPCGSVTPKPGQSCLFCTGRVAAPARESGLQRGNGPNSLVLSRIRCAWRRNAGPAKLVPRVRDGARGGSPRMFSRLRYPWHCPWETVTYLLSTSTLSLRVCIQELAKELELL